MTTNYTDSTCYEEFYPYLEPELPKCPRPLILSTIRNCLADFLRLTQAWTYDIPEINIIKDQVTYELVDIPDCSMIDTLNEVRIYWTQADRDNTDSNGTILEPIFDYTMADRSTIKLCQKPSEDVTNGLVINTILRPKRDADAIPNRLFDDIYLIVTYGVLTRLMIMKNKAWSNNESASLYAQMYQQGVGQIRVQKNKGYMNANITAHSPYLWSR